jgi:hypothetical protein
VAAAVALGGAPGRAGACAGAETGGVAGAGDWAVTLADVVGIAVAHAAAAA